MLLGAFKQSVFARAVHWKHVWRISAHQKVPQCFTTRSEKGVSHDWLLWIPFFGQDHVARPHGMVYGRLMGDLLYCQIVLTSQDCCNMSANRTWVCKDLCFFRTYDLTETCLRKLKPKIALKDVWFKWQLLLPIIGPSFGYSPTASRSIRFHWRMIHRPGRQPRWPWIAEQLPAQFDRGATATVADSTCSLVYEGRNMMKHGGVSWPVEVSID